eukprot:2632130-Prymnesium_polylepis.2
MVYSCTGACPRVSTRVSARHGARARSALKTLRTRHGGSERDSSRSQPHVCVSAEARRHTVFMETIVSNATASAVELWK